MVVWNQSFVSKQAQIAANATRSMAFDMKYLLAIWASQRRPSPTERRERQIFELRHSKLSQRDPRNMHMWCVDENGQVQDPYRMNEEDEDTWGRCYFEPDLKIYRLPWEDIPPFYHEWVLHEQFRQQKGAIDCSRWTGEDKDEILIKQLKKITDNVKKMPNACITIVALQSIIYGWEIKVGSLGWDCDLDGIDIWWEYGNGDRKCPYEWLK